MYGSKIAYRLHFGRTRRRLKWCLACLLFIAASGLDAQPKRWYFFDHTLSKEVSGNRLIEHGLEPVVWSSWFHAWSARGELSHRMPGVDSSQYVTPLAISSASLQSPQLGFALEQLGAGTFTKQGLTGKGIKIGIIDGGFLDADKSESLAPLLSSDQLKAFRNFVNPSLTNPFAGSYSLDDEHGTEVWELIGGFHPRKRIQFGLATGADYYLAVTDHGAREERQEEDFLIAALEWLDSLNVKLVNISLGYNTGYDDPAEEYKREMMDGKTALASLACQRATEEEGMLIVVAAGNDGNTDWQIIDVPADPPGVLTVGATDLKYWRKMPFSSIGADFTPFIKPDISCFASTGTSFSAPIITGLAACLWEAQPLLTNRQLKSLILESGHLTHAPNNYLGHGVPDAGWLLAKIQSGQWQEPAGTNKRAIPTKGKKLKITLEGEGTKQIVLYHKKDSVQVITQEFFTHTEPFLLIKKPDNAAYTTIVADKKWLMEVRWEH